jgi:hypothetical protein
MLVVYIENIQRGYMRHLIPLIILLTLSSEVFAQGSDYRYGDIVRIQAGDTVSVQVIAGAEWVEVNGHIRNDLYTAARQLSIDGSIEDDAIVFGDIITIRGSVGDMVAGAGQTILIDGEIGGDLIMAAREIRFTENARVRGNVSIGAESVYFEGNRIDGSVRLAAKSANLNGEAGGHVLIYSNDVVFGNAYRDGGRTRIVSTEPLYRDNLGNIPPNLQLEVRKPGIFPVVMFQAWFYLSLLVTGIVLLSLFFPTASDLQRFSTERFWLNISTGFGLFILIPLAIILLVIPILTIPLAVILSILYVLALFISYLMVAMILGFQFMTWFVSEPKKSTYYWALVLGLILIAILNNVPFLGGVFSILLLFFGIGSMGRYIYKRYDKKQVNMETASE